MNYKPILILALGALSTLLSYGWGQKGHDTTAYIAENHLTSTTKNIIDSLLDGKSIVYYSNWLDNASHTPEYAYSKTWHYKNIDADMDFDSAPVNPDGDVVNAINSQTLILTDPATKKEDKALALKIIVHLLGDIHQPMHLGHASDLGGNRWTVKYFGSGTNLHGLWDSKLVESAHKWSYTEWQQQIDRATPEQTMEILSVDTPDKWARQTYVIAQQIYDETLEDTNISYDYISNWTPTIEQQLLYGGLRLANLLNSIFDPEYIGTDITKK